MTKVFLIEDDWTMASLLNTLLRFEGYEVTKSDTNVSLEEMLSHIEAEQPDLVFMDVNLQQFSGLDLLQQMRQREKTANVKVLMTSGSDFSDQCRSAGADGFLLKPYMPEDLIQQFHRLLESSASDA